MSIFSISPHHITALHHCIASHHRIISIAHVCIYHVYYYCFECPRTPIMTTWCIQTSERGKSEAEMAKCVVEGDVLRLSQRVPYCAICHILCWCVMCTMLFHIVPYCVLVCTICPICVVSVCTMYHIVPYGVLVCTICCTMLYHVVLGCVNVNRTVWKSTLRLFGMCVCMIIYMCVCVCDCVNDHWYAIWDFG